MSPVCNGRLRPLSFLCILLAVLPATAARAISRLLSPHVPAAAAISAPVGKLPEGKRLNLSIGLPLRHQELLSDFLTELYDPASPRFHQYLSTAEFTQQFGPSADDYQALIAFAQSQGFTISATHPNRMLLSVTATVADIQRAFHITLYEYPHPTEARTFYAPDREPSINLAVPVLHIGGLDNFIIPRPASLHPRPGSNPTNAIPLGGSGPGGAYRGNDFRGAYARGSTLTGTNQMVGLFEFDGFYANDITNYALNSNIRNVPIETVLMDGLDGTPSTNNVEVALDIQVAMAMAPGLTQIIVYEGLDTDDMLSRMATDNLAKQLSASWLYPVTPTSLQLFRQLAAQGQSFFTASGDDGAYSAGSLRPTDDPYVISVGGTTLSTTGPGGAWVSETTWNWASVGRGMQASGGGISLTNRLPAWQQGISMAGNKGSTVYRNSPDVAMVGDNVWVVFDNGSNGSFGGTSCSAPLWAAFTALINQQAASLSQPPVGLLSPAVYALGKSSGYSTNFHDITTGNNTNTASPTLFYAVAGYDLCTGWGTPIGASLINALAPRAPIPVITNAGAAIVAEGCTPANGTIDPGETVSVSFTLRNIGGVKTTNLVATLQGDAIIFPSSPQSYGSLAAAGGAASRTFSFTPVGTCGDNLTVTLQLSDGASNLGSAFFNFALGKPISALSQNFDGVTAPALPSGWTSSIYSNGVAWVTSAGARDTAPNSAFALEAANPGITELLSPSIQVTTSNALLSFRNSYNTEVDPLITNRAYDGGVLEIQIGTSPFVDILSAGGSFLTNGYTRTIDATNDNPLAGRQAWAGNSGAFVPTLVSLPSSAAGQSIRLKWRFGTDTGNFYGGFGWNVDSIAINDGATCCFSSADVTVDQTNSLTPTLGGNFDYSITVKNMGPQSAYNVTVTDVLPPTVVFVSGPPGCVFTNGTVVYSPGTLANGSSTSLIITVTPATADPLTNVVNITCATADPALANNTSTLLNQVSTNSPPVILAQPTSLLVPAGADANFQVTASGPPPLVYQWFFNGNSLPGATGNSLGLTNVQNPQVGPYFVVVTNSQGSVTSSIAQLSLLLPPTLALSSLSTASNGLNVTLTSISGATYALEYKNSLLDSNWTALPPTAVGTGSLILLQDTNGFSLPSRFYRVRAY